MSEMVWRSTVNLPRDGTVIAVLYRSEHLGVTADALRYVDDGDGPPVWCRPGIGEIFDDAADFDPDIIGWFPLPQLAVWSISNDTGDVRSGG